MHLTLRLKDSESTDFSAQEDVRRNVEVIEERQVLIDHRNAESACAVGRADRDSGPINSNTALIRYNDTAQDFHESRLARSVVADNPEDLIGHEIHVHASKGPD